MAERIKYGDGKERKSFRLRIDTDVEQFLNSHKNKTFYINELIRQDMKKESR